MTIRNKIKNSLTRLEKIVWSKKSYKVLTKDWFRDSNLEQLSQLINTVRFSEKIQPILLDTPHGTNITVLAPHPDDEMIGPGGTLIKASKSGANIHVIYLTSGNEKEAADREKESRNICDKLGWKTSYLKNPLGKEDWNTNTLKDALNVQKKIDVLMLPFLTDDHPDHRYANKYLMQALNTNTLQNIEIWAYQVYSAVIPNVVIDITEQKDIKANYIKQYKTQMKSRDWSNFALGLNAWTSRWLIAHGKPKWAEGFFVTPIQEYMSIVKKYYRD